MKKADLRAEIVRLHRINAARLTTVARLQDEIDRLKAAIDKRDEVDRLKGRAEVTPAPSLVDRTRDAAAGWLDDAGQLLGKWGLK